MSDLKEQYLSALEGELGDLLASTGPPYTTYYQMIHYHMGWLDADMHPTDGRAGKRIRPLLCLLTCSAAGGNYEQALPAAAAIETLHNFSLLHDDIEDDSDTRRGRPTVWKLWGVPQAINTGDGMFALAHLALIRLPQRGVSPDRTLTAMQLFDQTCLTLTHGQFLDMEFEHRLDVSVNEYLTMIEAKTAALIATSTHLGALLAGADGPTCAHWRAFGRHLGLTFQIRDDILGIWGDAETIGKSTATDILTRKKTLPVVYGLTRSPQLRAWYAAPIMPPDRVPRVAQELAAVGARQMAAELAAEHHQHALEALERALPAAGAASPAGQALQELATALLSRSR